MSGPAGRSTAAPGGADVFHTAVAPAIQPAEPTSPGHGRTRQFRLGATFVPDPEPEVVAGTLLGAQERYRVVELLGQGGMGRVYEARRERDARPVALKVLRCDRVGAKLEELVARFRQEAAAASRVGHAGIVEVLGFERTPDGRVLLAMELLRGRTLEDWMSSEGTLCEGLELVARFCDALHAAHEAGIVHRDIKPENLFLHREADGSLRPTILDFGLAKVDVPDHTQIETAAGTVLGTPYYLAPERALGKPLTRSADLYSIGVVLYELVTGVLPFDAGAFMAILEGHVRRVPLDPRQAAPQRPIPDAVCEFVMALLSKDPQQRPRTAASVSLQIRQLLRTEQAALQRCPTGPRATSTPDADTMSMLALADGHTAAPATSRAGVATVSPRAPTVAQGPRPASRARPGSAAARGRLGLFVGLGALGGATAVVGFLLLLPAETRPPAGDSAAAAAEGVDIEPPTPEAPAPASKPPAEPAPIESVVAVPKAAPKPERTPSTRRRNGGTTATSRAQDHEAAPADEDSEAALQPEANEGKPAPAPAFKDDVYDD